MKFISFGCWNKGDPDDPKYPLYHLIESLKKDIPIEEGLKTIAQSEKNNWILFDRVNPGNIVRTFMRYEWEY